MKDFAVVGGGVGGTLASLFLSKNFSTTMFEKEPYLGGCSSTFHRGGNFYNSGATTFAGYSEGMLLYDFFKEYNIDFDKKLLDSTLSVIYESKKIKRYKDLDRFLDSLNSVFANKKHKEFYELIIQINKEFYSIKNYYYTNKSYLQKVSSILSFKELFFKLYPYILKNAKQFLKSFYGELNEDYLDYVDNQILIVAQAKTDEVNVLTMALALGYQFLDNYYIYGGMNSIFEAIAPKIDEIKYEKKIEKIDRKDGYFRLYHSNEVYEAKNIVLNSTVFDSKELFVDKSVLEYLDSYKKFDNKNSAFMVYLKIDTDKKFDHHYQIIKKQKFKYSISNSVFVSFYDQDDNKMSGSVTISTHTSSDFWKENSKIKKKELVDIIVSIFMETFDLSSDEIIKVFGATPHTFKRYINRSSLGGIAVTSKNLFFRLPANDTPIKGLYLVGDTSFAAQGWPGVMMGVQNLRRLICKI